jgi:phosphoglycerate dehydrogenase-like enzyme
LLEALDKEILIGVADDSASSVAGDVEYPNYNKLLDHPKIIVTPHIAWNTDHTKRKANDIMINNIEARLNKNPINIIT